MELARCRCRCGVELAMPAPSVHLLSFTDHRPSLPHRLNRQSGRESASRTLRSSRLAAFGVVVDERGQAATDGWTPSWSPAHTGPVGRRSPQPAARSP